MTPETIASRESKFATTLTDSSGKKFTAGNPIDIGDGFSIIPISPGFKTYFYQFPGPRPPRRRTGSRESL